ncbi:MAG TPA: hypothetical protein VGJ25_16265 [Gaiellaceae bacterium]
MRLADEVDAREVHPVLWAFLGAIAYRHRLVAGVELVVTSLRRPPGPRPSLHAPPPGQLCRAADLRRWYLDTTTDAPDFVNQLRHAYGRELGVVLEPEELTPEEIAERGGVEKIAGHIHIQLKRQEWPALV